MNEKGKLAPTNRGFKKKQTISRSERKKKTWRLGVPSR